VVAIATRLAVSAWFVLADEPNDRRVPLGEGALDVVARRDRGGERR